MDGQKDNKKTKKRIFIAVAAVVIIAAVTASFILFKGKQKQGEAAAETTEVQAVKMTIENTLEADGQIVSALEENVIPHTSYYLDEINVEQGDAVKEGKVILTYTNGYTMTAPYDCVVESWELPDPEEQLTSDHYVTIAGVDVMEMDLSVSESEVASLELGQPATVTVEATGKSYDADVSYISQSGSYSNGTSTFSAKVTFDNDNSVKLGMSATVVIPLEKAEDVIAVPVGAVNTRGGQSYVSVKTDSGVSPAEVETGISNGSFVEIKSGLNEGDTVIVIVSDDSSSSQWGGGFPGGGNGPPDMGSMPEGMPGGGNKPGGSKGSKPGNN